MQEYLPQRLKLALNALPPSLLDRSGSIFYSGAEAYQSNSALYVLGLNPGGDPDRQASETIGKSLDQFYERRAPWSAYADESWKGAIPGTWGLQPRLLGLLSKIDLDPQKVPASNVVFVRTRTEKALKQEKAELLKLCWDVHQAVIDALGVEVIACLGTTAGDWVARCLGAHEVIDRFEENNDRRWRSWTRRTATGLKVVTLTHPGRANWLNPLSDPSALVVRALRSR